MDLMPVDDLRMTFHDVCLPLSLFRVLKGRKSKYLSLQQHRRPSLIHTLHVNRESCSHVVYGVYVYPSIKSSPVRGRSCSRRQPSSPALSPHHVTLRYPDLILTYRTLTCLCPSVCPPCCSCFLSSLLFSCAVCPCPDLSLCYGSLTALHYTMQQRRATPPHATYF